MSPLQTETVQIPNGDLQIAAYLSYPVSAEPLPAVIVVQEIFGLMATFVMSLTALPAWVMWRSPRQFINGWPQDLKQGTLQKT